MSLGKVIRKYRKLKNLTQEEMAKQLGVTAPAVNKWENENLKNVHIKSWQNRKKWQNVLKWEDIGKFRADLNLQSWIKMKIQ